jgi:hypothetical protein
MLRIGPVVEKTGNSDALVTPAIGAVNGGGPTGPGGPDIQFQADANASLIAVPEPTTVTLIGLGLASLFGYGWRRKRA